MLSSLSDVGQADGAKLVEVRAAVHPGIRDKSVNTIRPTRGGGTDTLIEHHTWVVALSDPGAGLDAGVPAWATAPGYLKPDQVQPWLDALEAALEQGPVVMRVGQRTDERPDTGRMKAVRNAEASHGVHSARPALILVFDP